ncbi:hypothetical protein ASC90_18165 [Rhizobium sp. Root1220]|nr:hypothetical protein ASC90_18165 [Rhizobium sp. Root1220]
MSNSLILAENRFQCGTFDPIEEGNEFVKVRKISAFLTKYKETAGANAAFVTFPQQRMGKAVANTPNG